MLNQFLKEKKEYVVKKSKKVLDRVIKIIKILKYVLFFNKQSTESWYSEQQTQ